MKNTKRIIILVLAAFIFCMTALFLIRAIPSNFGRKPFYNLSADQVESGEVVTGIGYFDLGRSELSKDEIERVCELLKPIQLLEKTDPTKFVIKDGSLGDNYECFCLYMKNGEIIRVASDASDRYFYKNFVRYTIEKDSISTCIDLQRYHDQLVLEKRS